MSICLCVYGQVSSGITLPFSGIATHSRGVWSRPDGSRGGIGSCSVWGERGSSAVVSQTGEAADGGVAVAVGYVRS
ncbi:hypothetical protein FKM82_000465 [Ascaphus truei]